MTSSVSKKTNPDDEIEQLSEDFSVYLNQMGERIRNNPSSPQGKRAVQELGRITQGLESIQRELTDIGKKVGLEESKSKTQSVAEGFGVFDPLYDITVHGSTLSPQIARTIKTISFSGMRKKIFRTKHDDNITERILSELPPHAIEKLNTLYGENNYIFIEVKNNDPFGVLIGGGPTDCILAIESGSKLQKLQLVSSDNFMGEIPTQIYLGRKLSEKKFGRVGREPSTILKKNRPR